MDCYLCKKKFYKAYACNIHKKLHEFKCKHCHRQFYSEVDLKQHEKDQIDFKRTCNICNAVIFGKEMYAYHRRKHVKKRFKETRKYHCDCCKRSFLYEKSFKSHRFKCENKPTNLSCDLCSTKSFKRKYDLEQHVRKHTSEYTYTCRVCFKGFMTRNYLIVHSRSHGLTTEDPFKCEHCDKAFSKRFNLKRHLHRVHNGVPKESREEITDDYILIGLEIQIL